VRRINWCRSEGQTTYKVPPTLLSKAAHLRDPSPHYHPTSAPARAPYYQRRHLASLGLYPASRNSPSPSSLPHILHHYSDLPDSNLTTTYQTTIHNGNHPFPADPGFSPIRARARRRTDQVRRRKHPNNDKPTCASPRRRRRKWAGPSKSSPASASDRRSRPFQESGSVRLPPTSAPRSDEPECAFLL
jgi:hypothetical protein